MVKYSHGKWWMTYGLSGDTGSEEFSRAGLLVAWGLSALDSSPLSR